MKIHGIDGMTVGELNQEIERGGKFVIYQYCISIVVMTFKRPSDIYFIRGGEGSIGKGLGYTLASLVLGWWGIPWGPIYTIGSVANNLGGGKNVTSEVMSALRQQAAA